MAKNNSNNNNTNGNKNNPNSNSTISTDMQEFINFISNSANLFKGDSFEQVLSDTVKMNMYLNIYEKLSLLPGKKLASLALAAKNIS